jgi:hypothetical protein
VPAPLLPPAASSAPLDAASVPLAAASHAASAVVAVAAAPAAPVPPPLLLPSLKARLGAPIGPREASAPPPDKELP